MEPVFICGHRKGGTSLFRNLLEGHPDLMVYPNDLNLLYAYFPDFSKKENEPDKLKTRLKKILIDDLHNQLSSNNKKQKFDFKEFETQFFKDLSSNRLKDLKYLIEKLIDTYKLFYKNYSTDRRNFIPVVKETSIEIYASEIFTWFPNAKFIQIVREPKDNYSALKAGVSTYYSKLGENEKETLASTINRAKLGMELGLLNRKRFGQNKYKLIKFEDIVTEPEDTLSDVCDFLNIKFDNILLTPTQLGQPIKGNSFNQEKKFTTVSSQHVSKWKERISKEEAQIIEFYFKDLMQHFSYEVNFPEIQMADSVSEFYKWKNYRYYFHDRFK